MVDSAYVTDPALTETPAGISRAQSTVVAAGIVKLPVTDAPTSVTLFVAKNA